MSAIDNIFDMFPDRLHNGKNSQIFTPPHIAKDMVDLLPEDIFNKDSTFLDICCKSGILLYKIYLRLMESKSMIADFKNEKDRREYIIHNQLFGIAPDPTCQLLATRTVYGYLETNSHIIHFGDNYNNVMTNTDKRFLIERLQKEFNIMKFDVVIGNPPYNKGMDLDFVDTGFKLSNTYTCFITPAKWQTAEAEQKIVSKMSYGEFRKQIVPHMNHVCFYPDCLDVFGIAQADGISYYLIDKNNTYEDKCTVANKCNLQKCIESEYIRDITKQQSLWNIGQEIVDYLGDYDKYFIQDLSDRKEYTININKQLRQSLSGAWDWKNGGIDPQYIGGRIHI